MPIPNHCIECDKPTMNILCDKCKKEETNQFIKSIIKKVDKITELTKQLQKNIDNSPILKEKSNIYRKVKIDGDIINGIYIYRDKKVL